MKPMKKSKFFTFIFSFLPGAAEMYVGLMKNGLSLMGIFFLMCAIMASVRFDAVIAVIAVVWFWGFFHARNIASMDEESLGSYEDRYIWEEYLEPGTINIKDKTLRKWLAVAIIIIGIGMVWDYLLDLAVRFIPDAYWDMIYPLVSDMPTLVVGILLIVGGAVLVKGKKKELKEEITDGETVKNA